MMNKPLLCSGKKINCRRNIQLRSLVVILFILIIGHNAGVCSVFLIQNKDGGIIGLSYSQSTKELNTDLVRPPSSEFNNPAIADLELVKGGGFQLAVSGALTPLGSLQYPTEFWRPLGACDHFALTPSGTGGWFVVNDHIITRNTPPLVFPSFNSGEKIVDVEYDKISNRLVLLFENGEIVTCLSNSYQSINHLKLKNESAIDFELNSEGFMILTNKPSVYHVTSATAECIQEIPDLSGELVCDLELSPFGEGYYLLSVFGDLHAFGNAPEIKTTPLGIPVAIDFEWMEGNTIPRWYPPGWNTTVSLLPPEVSLDPQGASKSLSINIENAENLSSFIAEIRYDPKYITVDLEGVQSGSWWEHTAREARVAASLDNKNGRLFLRSTSTFLPFEGSSGEGELLRFPIAANQSVTHVTTTVEMIEFDFGVATPGNMFFKPAPVKISSSTVWIAPIQPAFGLDWEMERKTRPGESSVLQIGDIIRIDMMIENGSRIAGITFDFSFSRETMNFLGMTLGDVWEKAKTIVPQFDFPSIANEKGGLTNQRIFTMQAGACRDAPGTMIHLFFAITDSGKHWFDVPLFQAQGHWKENLETLIQNKKLSF